MQAFPRADAGGGRVYFPDVNAAAAAAAAAARDWTDLLGKGEGPVRLWLRTYARTRSKFLCGREGKGRDERRSVRASKFRNKAIFYLLGWVPNGKKTAPPEAGLLLPTWTDVLCVCAQVQYVLYSTVPSRVTVPVVGRGRGGWRTAMTMAMAGDQLTCPPLFTSSTSSPSSS